jgi:hypothetical protein
MNTNISPSILSWGLIPISLLHLGSSFVLSSHSHEKSLGSVPFLWTAIFYAGGFILMFLAGVLIVIRRGEHTRYQLVDKTALAIAVSAIVVFAILRRSI